jgi:hypothetical protein
VRIVFKSRKEKGVLRNTLIEMGQEVQMAYSLTTWNEFKNYQRRRDLREGELVDGDYT